VEYFTLKNFLSRKYALKNSFRGKLPKKIAPPEETPWKIPLYSLG